MTLLQTIGLTRHFGSVVAARDLSLRVGRDEVVGIIGANGAGKTTFVNMVTGYLTPERGHIRFADRDITGLGPRQITRLGICRSFQVPQVFQSASVLENLLIALGVSQATPRELWRPLHRPALREGAETLLARYGLGGHRDRAAGLLPQGMRKLLDIAMAAARKPRMLLLDEPTSGVSVEEKYGIMDTVMGALREAGVTVLFVEHDMDIVARHAQRVLAFYDGGIIADGAPDAVLRNHTVRELVLGEPAAREEAADAEG